MTIQETPLPSAREARRAAFADLAALLKILPKPRWATPLLILLGLLSSFAEAAGITLVLLFFYLALGKTGLAAETGGLVGSALGTIVGHIHGTRSTAAIILLLIVLRGALSFLYNVITAEVSDRISEAARNLIHEQYLTVSYGFIRKHEQAKLMDVLGIESWLVSGAHSALTRIVVNACSAAFFGALLLALSWRITAIAAIGALAISFGLRRLSAPARRLGERVRTVNQQLGEHVLMTLEGMRTIRAYGQEEAHQRRFVDCSARAREVSVLLTRLSCLLGPLTEVGYLAILCGIVIAAEAWRIDFAAVMASVALLYRLLPHVRELEANLLYMAQIAPQLRSLRSMLDRSGKPYPPPGHLAHNGMVEGIRFEGVRFAYEAGAPPVLDGATFTIPAGKTTALVGASGAGKTTIVSLLLRLYQPGEGAITVDGVNLGEIERAGWLSRLSVAGQDVDLVEGTVIENIRMADNDAGEDAVMQAARLAGVAEFIEPLEEGYATWIGQQGLRFSGGQRQRLGLARALLRDPAFLILDEAMSALDKGLEDRIRQAIASSRPGRTILLITHRPESVRSADHIVYLENGRVVSEGPPG